MPATREPFFASNGATRPTPLSPPENPAHAIGHLSEPGKLRCSASMAARVIAPRHAAVSFRAGCGPSPASSTQPSASPTLRYKSTRSSRFCRLKSLVEHTTNTGQLFRGSKFEGVASTATAFGGTAFPPWPANDFSCALKGTLVLTVEPGEKATPSNVNEPAVAATEPAWSSRINPAIENSRPRVPQTC